MPGQSKNIQVLFHRAQKHQAEQIFSDLAGSKYNFRLINASEQNGWTDKVNKDVLLWLISDNFLKSLAAMDEAIDVLEKRDDRSDLLLIVSPGLYPDNDLEIINEVPTRFNRMGDIIPYMNFWQTEYLDMRKWRRNIPEIEQEVFDIKLEKVRKISSKIGEFLQHLKKSESLSWMDLVNQDYKDFFELVSDPGGYKALSLNDKRALVELINASSAELIRENEEQEEELEIDFEDIPGMDLLSKASNVVQEVMSETENKSPWRADLQEATEQVLAGQVETGISTIKSIIAAYPKVSEPKFRLALIILEHQDDAEAASTLLESVCQLDPEHVSAHFLLGEIAEWKSDFDKAKMHYEIIYKLDKSTPDLRYRLGMLYALHFPEEPLLIKKLLQKAVKENDTRSDAHYQLGLLYQERLFKLKNAKKQFLKTLSYQSGHPFANYDLALIAHQEGNFKNARSYYLEAIKNNLELKTPENEEAFKLRQEIINSPVENLMSNKPVVLITGATSGIGRATAELFSKKGYNLILTGRRKKRLEALKEKLTDKDKGGKFSLVFDVRDQHAVKKAIKSLRGRWAEIDILINNAGLAMGLSPVHEGSIEHWETMLDTNVKGLLYLTRTVSPKMVERKNGHIINVCSIAGKEVYPNGNVYCASKHAVEALTKAFRLDLYKYGIKVGQVSPAHVEETEFALVRFEGNEEKAKIYNDFQPLKSKDVANAILFIATQPEHVNVQDILLMGTQQAGSTFIDRSGR